MKKLIVLMLLAMATQAKALEVVNFSSWQCDVINTNCSLVSDDANIISASFLPPNGSLTISELDANGNIVTVTEIAPVVYAVATKNSLYSISVPFSVIYPNGDTLSGQVNKVRSGSGRGGWMWHTHWVFFNLVSP